MVLWISVGVLISIALLTVIITLLKNINEEHQDYEEVVYLDQLDEIEKDLMKGNLNLSEKEEIYSELEKRAKSRSALEDHLRGDGYREHNIRGRDSVFVRLGPDR